MHIRHIFEFMYVGCFQMLALNHIVVKSLNVSKTCSSSGVEAQGTEINQFFSVTNIAE